MTPAMVRHYAQIAEVAGITAADTVTAVLGTSASVPSSSLDLQVYRFARFLGISGPPLF